MSDLIVSTSPLDPRAKPLVDELIHEYDSRYGDLFDRDGAVVELNRYPPEAFAPPSGHFLLLIRDGVTIAGGGFKRYDEQTAEFKRIWTRHDLRRQGLASQVLVALEEAALRQGYRRIYLTTGFRQPEAVGLYLRRGYTALFDPAADLAALRRLPFEKWLAAQAEAPPAIAAA
ncbi:GNAT family N-acetyltransferase [Roseomonas sp. GC11]|uniref:GNAT family N-acetyltransferase n=1 Tax=Roseomonas sp. GC11 TaxID=2950546 RepID=UPI00210B8951|nr:GNAT family N-acetyltransferase [Roseomonas sp. GC11]MCQ4159072.1 GNAT family N-acetyltransferase [Roseomonas sp. GC11]